MKNRFKLFGMYLPIYLAILVATVTLKTVACFTSLNLYGHFSDPLMINISASLLGLGTVIFLFFIWTSKRDLKLVPAFATAANYVPSAAVSVALTFIAIHLFSFARAELSAWHDSYLTFKEVAQYYPQAKMPLPEIGVILAFLSAIFAILSIIYFVFTGMIEKVVSIRRANYGLLTLLFLCFYLAYIYFDNSLPLNAPNKISDQMAYLSATLFFLYETRLSLGREKWRPYIAFGFIASLLTAFSSIPALIIYFAEKRIISNSIYETLLTLALFVFITSKLMLTANLIEDKKSPIIENIILASAYREQQINPTGEAVEETSAEEASEEPDENQISITDVSDREMPIDSDGEFSDDEKKDELQ